MDSFWICLWPPNRSENTLLIESNGSQFRRLAMNPELVLEPPWNPWCCSVLRLFMLTLLLNDTLQFLPLQFCVFDLHLPLTQTVSWLIIEPDFAIDPGTIMFESIVIKSSSSKRPVRKIFSTDYSKFTQWIFV